MVVLPMPGAPTERLGQVCAGAANRAGNVTLPCHAQYGPGSVTPLILALTP